MNLFDMLVSKAINGGGGSGTSNYNELSNKPQINDVTLTGNKTAANLGLQAEITGEVTISSDNVDDTDATNLFVTSTEKSTWTGKQDALTFDDAPTENSTNPVKSGGVYTALSGKQPTLTFDDTPTSGSSNPVKSGGVYSALGNKQDTVSFDGTYSSSNKAATVSTVTNAVNALDVAGASNIAASKTLASWSEADGKVSITTQDIAITGSQAVLTGYQIAQSKQSIAATDTTTEAFGKVEQRVQTNENNILFNADNGVKNLLKNTAVSTVSNTVTFTVNDDKSIRVQGKPSSGIAEIVLSDLSELVDGQTYKLYGNQATNRTSFQIIGGSGIANIYATEAGTEFTFIRANYVRAVVRTQADAQTTDITIKPMITIPTMDGSTYQPNAKTNVELTNLTEEARTIYVGANEKFTKLTDAMKYAFEHKNTIVRVGAGTYNIISEMGNSYWANFTSYSDLTHAHIGNGSHFIFSPDSKVVCEYTGDNTNVNQLYSPFNSLDGNEGDFTLEGLTLVVSGCRYAIHDDIGASTVRQTHKYINCEITNDIRCIGAGLGADETVEMRDCIFHSTGAVGNSPVSWHNSGGGTTGKGSIVMTGCYVDGAGDNAVQFLAYGVSPKETNVIVSNNSFNAAPSCRKYDETIQYMNFKMLDFNNEIRT